MDQASNPLHGDDDCCDDTCHAHGHLAPLSPDVASTPIALESSRNPRKLGRVDLIIQAARADAASIRSVKPFLLQADRTLYIVASEPTGWVVAELTFDPECCVFTEQSRTQFDWPREAFGRLLSKVYLTSDIKDTAFDEIAGSFERWLAQQFVA